VRERNPRGEGARLREEIVSAAEALLDEAGGEEAVTLRAVARRVGIAAPSIYAHFPDRQAILLAVVRRAFADLEEQLQAAAGTADEPAARVRAVAGAYLGYAERSPQRYRVMFAGVWDAAAALDGGGAAGVTAQDVAGLGQEVLGVLTAALQACRDAGASTTTDPAADAVALWLGLHGLAHQRSVARAFPWPADIAARVVDPLARLR
jgi:AcrR family transcriptional regulator